MDSIERSPLRLARGGGGECRTQEYAAGPGSPMKLCPDQGKPRLCDAMAEEVLSPTSVSAWRGVDNP